MVGDQIYKRLSDALMIHILLLFVFDDLIKGKSSEVFWKYFTEGFLKYFCMVTYCQMLMLHKLQKKVVDLTTKSFTKKNQATSNKQP